MVWQYKIINRLGEFETGEFNTDLKASVICKYFEDTGAELISLKKIDISHDFAFIVPQFLNLKKAVDYAKY